MLHTIHGIPVWHNRHLPWDNHQEFAQLISGEHLIMPPNKDHCPHPSHTLTTCSLERSPGQYSNSCWIMVRKSLFPWKVSETNDILFFVIKRPLYNTIVGVIWQIKINYIITDVAYSYTKEDRDQVNILNGITKFQKW